MASSALMDPSVAWAEFADQLRVAGERLGRVVAGLDTNERADGYRALVRATNNQLGRFEVDRERPELVSFNGWREKFLMDNPDFRYWVADLRDDRRYRIVGCASDAAYLSITAYTSTGVLDAAAAARLDLDELDLDEQGQFTVTLSAQRPEHGAWLELPPGARSVWVRMFIDGPIEEHRCWCRIDALDDPLPPDPIDPERLAAQLRRSGTYLTQWPSIVERSLATDLAVPNTIRHWTEMTGGAAFTEPGIHYLRGSWSLDHDEALVIEGELPPCRYWNVLLYSRFLNSLDHRHRRVSRTASSSTIADGRYRYVLSPRDPGPDVAGDWLDTEGRGVGIVVLRFLHATSVPILPTVSRVTLGDLACAATAVT